jgi:HSP20 family protein
MEITMANITRYDPLEDLFKGFWMKPVALPADPELKMRIDVKEDDQSFVVKAEVPGAKKEDIQIDIDDDRVTLRAEVKKEKEEKKGEKTVYSERAYGMVSRSFTLPVGVDTKDAKAEYKDGLLSVTLPKKGNGAAKRLAVS